MSWKNLAAGFAGLGAGLLIYGATVEANRLVVERRTLRLPRWPRRLHGFKIAVLADLHIREYYSARLATRAVEMALESAPDMVVLPGDIVGYWHAESARWVGEVLEPLTLMNGNVVAIPGNRESWRGSPELLRPILTEFGIKLLRNEAWTHRGITWVGVDSENAGDANPLVAFADIPVGDPYPRIVLWHEPDLIEMLPEAASLQISGHTHGGQFRTPWKWAPMKTRNGRRYVDGFFNLQPTPLYVSRGVGVTGPPSRLFCPPEVSILTLLGRD